MPTLTPNYSFNKPLVNNATDADLWGGYLNANWDSVDTILNGLGYTPAIGDVEFTTGNTNPSTKYAGTTWTQIAEGRFIVGVGQGTDADAANRTYPAGNDSDGTYEHTLTVAEMPSHSHDQQGLTSGSGSTVPDLTSRSATPVTLGVSTTSTGGGGAHENSPPAFGLYVWERTA